MSRPDLEQQLRAALADEAHGVTVSGDAWQQNQRRLARRERRGRGWLVAAAAAVVVLVALVGAGALFGGGGQPSRPAASGGPDDPFATQNILGEVVEVESGPVDGEDAVHEMVLTDPTGDGPQLCDRYLAESQAGGGCTMRLPSADDHGVAFDWLAETGGIGDLDGLVAGVDERVARVRIWLADGEELVGTLHPTGWEGTHMLAVSFDRSDPRAQRLVAYDDTGRVLQAVDLQTTFGDGWLRVRSACLDAVRSEIRGRWPNSDRPSSEQVVFGTNDALVRLLDFGSDSGPSTCVRLGLAPLAWVASPDGRIVVVSAPEVSEVRLLVDGGTGTAILPEAVRGVPWRAASQHVGDPALLQRAELAAYDGAGNLLDVESVNQPASP